MAGYYGYSMSNNAIEAYIDGEMPLSKWTKAKILSRISEAIKAEEVTLKCTFDDIKKISAKDAKKYCLKVSSWHHTSSHYNRTDFYDIDYEFLNNVTAEEIKNITSHTEAKETEPTAEVWECSFLEWSGSRKHPKATEYTEIGTIKGDWFYRQNGTKKKVSANGFQKIRRIEA